MRTAGRRTLAGVASGALLLTGAAFIAAPSAQAAPTIQAFCDTNNAGGGGVVPDPTTVVPNCAIGAGVGVQATITQSAFGVAAGNTWYRLSVSGDSVFQSLAVPLAGVLAISGDGKTVVADAAAMGALANTGDFWLTVPTQGVRTVTVDVSTDPSLVPPASATFAPAGELTVTGTGNSTAAVISQGYYAVNANNLVAAAAAPLAIVHVVDSSGAVLDLSAAAVGPITSTPAAGTIATALYAAGNCAPTGLLAAGVDPGGTAASGIVTDACATAVGAGVDTTANSGLWVTWDGLAAPAAPGTYTASFNLTVGGQTYPISIDYVVSLPLAVNSSGLAFDAESYLPGGLVTGSVTLRDAGGRIVPDGLGWTVPVVRPWAASSITNAPIFNPTTGLPIAPTAAFPGGNAVTYGGVATGTFLAPPDEMALFLMRLDIGAASNGWAAALSGTSTTDTARIGNPDPNPTPTIFISGTRGAGDDIRKVFVEGVTTNLVGEGVTPYFRFGGDSGFTQGNNVRTVDAEGNFKWMRKTGKRIGVQFRFEDIRSNTVIIAARPR
jgi:hypothetical protein